jgi:hypothetical protein
MTRLEQQSETSGLREALEEIADVQNPETFPGAHLTDKGRAQLAFAVINNVRKTAADALAAHPEESVGK